MDLIFADKNVGHLATIISDKAVGIISTIIKKPDQTREDNRQTNPIYNANVSLIVDIFITD